MKYSKDKYLKANIELSLSNTKIILNSIDSNIDSIIEITQKVQTIDDTNKSMMCLLKVKDMSLESVIEKCNMLKAALDRFTIASEDVLIPTRTKYEMLHPIPKELKGRGIEFKRFREKISKHNMPPMIAPPVIIEDDGDLDE